MLGHFRTLISNTESTVNVCYRNFPKYLATLLFSSVSSKNSVYVNSEGSVISSETKLSDNAKCTHIPCDGLYFSASTRSDTVHYYCSRKFPLGSFGTISGV